MNITSYKRQKWLSLVLTPLLLLSSFAFGGNGRAYAADLTITAAPTGTNILTQNGGSVVTTFNPELGSTLELSTTSSAVAYYGVRTQSATTTGDVHWRITVHGPSALGSNDVRIDEVGFFDADSNEVANSAYSVTASGGDIIFDGNSGWNTFAGDDFTDVDQLSVDPNAPTGTYTITRELIDNATGMPISGTYSFNVDVTASGTTSLDTTAPVFGTTTDVMATTTSSSGATVDFTNPTATDDVDGSVAVSCSPGSGQFFSLGTTTVNCTASDTAGNTASTSFNVIVSQTGNGGGGGTGSTTPISITAPILTQGRYCATTSPIMVSGTSSANSNIGISGGTSTSTATANGSGDFSGSVDMSANTSGPIVFDLFDSNGNVVASTTFYLVLDNTAPTITLNGPSVTSMFVGNTFVDQGVTASDNLDGSITATTTANNLNTSQIGTYTITYTATDCAGNMASTSRTVNVVGTGGGGGSSSGSSHSTGIVNAFQNASPNSAVAYILAGYIIDGNGIVGIPNTGGTITLVTLMKVGVRGAEVTELQTLLKELGYYHGPITGTFGPMTKAAVMAYQRAHGIVETGNVGVKTLAALNASILANR